MGDPNLVADLHHVGLALQELSKQGEDRIWRPCDAALPVIERAIAALTSAPTPSDLLSRLDLSGEADSSRLVVMAQNPANYHHWTRSVGKFTAGEVREALAQLAATLAKPRTEGEII